MSDTPTQEPYYGDLEKTQQLSHLFAVAREARDAAWQQRVIEHLAEASFRCGDPQVMTGPWEVPYFKSISLGWKAL
ncbi:MAG: hypothetical protein IPL92_19880 [Saprospiraceae bacterium]|nr:hypothetical protein [Candidatus Opimibacter iunctus]